MKHRAGGIQTLQLVLDIQGVEDIVGIPHRKMGAVCIIRGVALFGRGDYIRVPIHVMFGQSIRRRFRRGRLQIEETPVLLLVYLQSLPHMVQDGFGEIQRFGVGQVLAEPFRVQSRLIHADQPDGGKVIGKCAEIPFGIGIEPRIQQFGKYFPLDVQGTGGDVHLMIQSPVEFIPRPRTETRCGGG